jgi:hypothetical protein
MKITLFATLAAGASTQIAPAAPPTRPHGDWCPNAINLGALGASGTKQGSTTHAVDDFRKTVPFDNILKCGHPEQRQAKDMIYFVDVPEDHTVTFQTIDPAGKWGSLFQGNHENDF